MKIRLAQEQDISFIKKLWYENFLEHESIESINNYFEYHINLKYIVVGFLNNELICSLQLNQHQLFYNNNIYDVSFFVGVVTKKSHQRKGYMRLIMNYAFDYIKNELNQKITILQAYNLDVYRPFGFEVGYCKNEYQFNKEYFESYQNNDYIKAQKKDAKKLKILYDIYTSNKNGFKIRTESYYEQLIIDLKVDNGCIYLNDTSYVIVINDFYTLIHEFIYTNKSLAIFSCLNEYKNQKIIIKTDINCDLFENPKLIPFMMVKILDSSFVEKPIKDKILFISEII